MFEHNASADAEHARIIRRAMRREQRLIAARVSGAVDPSLQRFRDELDALLPEDMRPFEDYVTLYAPHLRSMRRERMAALSIGEAA